MRVCVCVCISSYTKLETILIAYLRFYIYFFFVFFFSYNFLFVSLNYFLIWQYNNWCIKFCFQRVFFFFFFLFSFFIIPRFLSPQNLYLYGHICSIFRRFFFFHRSIVIPIKFLPNHNVDSRRIRLINSIKFWEKISQLPLNLWRIFVSRLACVLPGRTIGQTEYSIRLLGLPFVHRRGSCAYPTLSYVSTIITTIWSRIRDIRKRIYVIFFFFN